MKNLITKIILFLSLVVLCLSFKTVETYAATDATSNPGSMDAIQELINRGIMDGTFNPDASITRAELAKIVAKPLGGNADLVSFGISFSDIPVPAWSFPPGLLTGISDGVYLPGTVVNREELATVVVSALGTYASGLVKPVLFNDSATISTWARDAVGYALGNGIMSVDPSNNFNPQSSVTVQEVAKTTLNALVHAEALGIILAPVPVSEPEPEPEKEESSEAKIKAVPDQSVIKEIVEEDLKIVLTDTGITIGDLLGAIVALDNSKQMYEFWRNNQKLEELVEEIISGDKLLVKSENRANEHTYSFELPDNPNNPPVGQEQVQEPNQQPEPKPPTEDVVVPE